MDLDLDHPPHQQPACITLQMISNDHCLANVCVCCEYQVSNMPKMTTFPHALPLENAKKRSQLKRTESRYSSTNWHSTSLLNSSKIPCNEVGIAWRLRRMLQKLRALDLCFHLRDAFS